MANIRVLFDLNIVLDVLAKRHPHYEDSVLVWIAAERGEVEGLLAAHSVTTLFYLMARKVGHKQATQIVADVIKVFSVAAVDEEVVKKALAFGWKDFEDAVQMGAAQSNHASYLVTRNPKDFKGGSVSIVEPTELYAILKAERKKNEN